MKIKINKGDISEIEAEAIVNAANNELWMGAGVAGALKRKGGTIIEDEALSKGPIEFGGAIETTAGNLKAKYVIHAAGMRSDGYVTKESIANSILNSLKLAEKLHLKTIAFPAIGTGIAGFSIASCAQIMYDIFKNFKFGTLEEITIVLYGHESYDVFLRKFEKTELEL